MNLKITRGKKARPQKVVWYGPEGVGKTTLAAQCPKPLFADCEGGTDHIDLARVEIHTIADFREACLYLIRDNSEGFESFIVDTADWLAARDVEEMLAEDEKDSVEDYGYGKGYKKAEERFHELLKMLDRVKKAGVHVILLAHSKVVKFEEPDKSGAYDRYELKLEKKISPLLKEWCDALLFLNFETRIVERSKGGDDGKKRGIGGNKRLLHCEREAAFDAKNRHGMPKVCDATIESLSPIFNFKGDEPEVSEAPAEKVAEKAPEAKVEEKPKPKAKGQGKSDIPAEEPAEKVEEKVAEKSEIDTAFDKVVAKAGGKEAVERFLKARDKTLAGLDDDYKARAVSDAARFAKSVADHSKQLAAAE